MSVETLAVSLQDRCTGAIVARCRRLGVDRPQPADLDDMTADALLAVLQSIRSNQYTSETLGGLIWQVARSTVAEWIDQRVGSPTAGDCLSAIEQHPRCEECAGVGVALAEDGYGGDDCDACQGTGDKIEPLPGHLLDFAYGNGGAIGADLRLTAFALSKGMTKQDTAAALKISRVTLFRRIQKLQDRLALFNPFLDQSSPFCGENVQFETSRR